MPVLKNSSFSIIFLTDADETADFTEFKIMPESLRTFIVALSYCFKLKILFLTYSNAMDVSE